MGKREPRSPTSHGSASRTPRHFAEQLAGALDEQRGAGPAQGDRHLDPADPADPADHADPEVARLGLELAELRTKISRIVESSGPRGGAGRSGSDADPLPLLREIKDLNELARHLEAAYVRVAVARGFSWREIGAALGVSRQSVHQKHGRATAE